MKTASDYDRPAQFADIAGCSVHEAVRRHGSFPNVAEKLLSIGAPERLVLTAMEKARALCVHAQVGTWDVQTFPNAMYGSMTLRMVISSTSIVFSISVPPDKPSEVATAEVLAAERCLKVILPLQRQDELIGDLLERYDVDGIADWPKWSARIWILRHSASMIWAGCQLRKLSLVAGVLKLLHKLASFGFPG